MISRRGFLQGSLATAAACVVGMSAPALAQTSPGQTQVQLAIDIMNGHGQTQYLLVDKRNATIHIVRDHRIIESSPVVLGRIRSDQFLRRGQATGAGIFPMVPLTQNNHIAFRAGDGVAVDQYTIHRVIQTQERLSALSTTQSSDNFLSNGCINVSDNFFDLIWANFSDSNGRFRDGFNVVILPENISQTSVFLSQLPQRSQAIPSTHRRRPNDDLLPVP